MTTMLLCIAVLFCVALRVACSNDSAESSDDRAEHGSALAHTNRLAQSTSPYLLQHKHNPVDWHEWGEAALQKAVSEDKPIFLSVGYSTCHWCHVMAHESFEDEQVAALLNEHFVPIKVDREQRPDIDSQYMLATQLVTGRGGWPNSVWLTPDGRPWFAGTYFPKHDQYGRPGFISVLTHLADAWAKQRPDIEQQADRLSDAIRRHSAVPIDERIRAIRSDILHRAVDAAVRNYDPQHGGFGAAPKFPPHAVLRLMGRHLLRAEEPDVRLQNAFTHTLDAMAMGGMVDHVGFGFHRYSTDAHWLLPHFEKMLYDNAQLLRAYTDGHRLTGHTGYRRIAGQIVQWLEHAMSDPGGGFYAAIDADSEGEEGKFYVWHWDEIAKLLGDEDAELYGRIYNILPEGNFTDEATGHKTGANIPHLTRPITAWAKELKTEPDALRARLDAMRIKLLEARDRRIHPHLDDKVLTGWNGLAIGALAYAGQHLNEPTYIQRAERCATFLLKHLTDEQGRLLRTWRAGQADADVYLDDYAYLLEGLIELHAVTDAPRWLNAAQQLADAMIERFADDQAGGFFFTADGADHLLGRSKNPLGGGNVPSPNGVAAGALLRLAEVTGNDRYADAGRQTLIAFAAPLVISPEENGALVLAADEHFRQSGAENLPVAETSPVSATLTADVEHATPGQPFHLHIQLDIADGYHLYAANDEDQIRAIRVEPQLVSGATFGEVAYPQPSEPADPVLGKTLKAYTGSIRITVPVMVEDDAEGDLPLSLKITWQACDAERCLLPQEQELEMTLPVRR